MKKNHFIECVEHLDDKLDETKLTTSRVSWLRAIACLLGGIIIGLAIGEAHQRARRRDLIREQKYQNMSHHGELDLAPYEGPHQRPRTEMER